MSAEHMNAMHAIATSAEPALTLCEYLTKFGDAEFDEATGGARREGESSQMSIPLTAAGLDLGMLTLRPDQPLNDDERAEIAASAEVAAVALAMRSLAERVDRLAEAQREYLDLFVHDAKTPITSIIGMAQTLKKRDRLDPEIQDEFINRIEGAARDLEGYVDEARAHLSVQLNAALTNIGECDLAAIARRAAGSLAVSGAESVSVRTDEGLLFEMLRPVFLHAEAISATAPPIVVGADGTISIEGLSGDESNYSDSIWTLKASATQSASPADPLCLIAPARTARVLGGEIHFEFNETMTILVRLPLA